MSFHVCSVGSWVWREAYVSVGPDWSTFQGVCTVAIVQRRTISCAYSLLIRVAVAVLSSMDRRAKAAFVAFRIMTVFRSALVSERHRPR